MQWTGNVARTFGHVLLALGVIALVLGIAGLVIGGLIVKDAATDPYARNGDVGDVLEGLVMGGLALTAFGTVSVVVALVLLGVVRALRERLQRTLAASASASGVGLSPEA